MRVWSVGPEDPLEEGMATHSSILAWRISWTEEPSSFLPTGLQRVRHNWSNLAQYNLKEVTPFESQVSLLLNGNNNTWLYLYNRVLHVKSASFISNDTCWEESSLTLGYGERVAADSTEVKAGWSWGGWRGGRTSASSNGIGSSKLSICQSMNEKTNHLAADINAQEGNGPFEAAKNWTCSSFWSLRDVYYQCFGHTLSLT